MGGEAAAGVGGLTIIIIIIIIIIISSSSSSSSSSRPQKRPRTSRDCGPLFTRSPTSTRLSVPSLNWTFFSSASSSAAQPWTWKGAGSARPAVCLQAKGWRWSSARTQGGGAAAKPSRLRR